MIKTVRQYLLHGLPLDVKRYPVLQHLPEMQVTVGVIVIHHPIQGPAQKPDLLIQDLNQAVDLKFLVHLILHVPQVVMGVAVCAVVVVVVVVAE